MVTKKIKERVFKYQRGKMITHVLVTAEGDTAFFGDDIPSDKTLTHNDIKNFYEEAERACLLEAGKVQWG